MILPFDAVLLQPHPLCLPFFVTNLIVPSLICFDKLHEPIDNFDHVRFCLGKGIHAKRRSFLTFLYFLTHDLCIKQHLHSSSFTRIRFYHFNSLLSMLTQYT